MRENTDQKNSEYGHFSYSAILGKMTRKMKDRKSGCIANYFESICFAMIYFLRGGLHVPPLLNDSH